MIAILIIALLFGIGCLIKEITANRRFATRYVALSDVDSMDGHDFEYYCADLLNYDGFSRISVTRGSNDQGVDIIAHKNGEKYAIQCKRYSNPLGNKPVQEVNTGRTIYGCSQAIVITNSYFTKGAIDAAKATGVLLWDREKLNSLIKAKQSGIKSSNRSVAGANGERIKKALAIFSGTVVLLVALVTIIFGRNVENEAQVTAPEEKMELLEEVQTGELSFTITNMMFARHYGNLKYLDIVDDAFVNCCVYANVENKNDHTVDLSLYTVFLNCNGFEYYQTIIEDKEFLFANRIIAKNESLNGKVISFRIPEAQQYSDSPIYITITSPNGQQNSWQLR